LSVCFSLSLHVALPICDSFAWAKSSTTGDAPIFETENLDAISAIKKHPEVDLIICSWAPNFGEDDVNILNLYRQLDYQPVLLFIDRKSTRLNSSHVSIS